MTAGAEAKILDGVRLLARHGGIVEARLLHTPKGTLSGYFDNLDALVEAVTPWDGKVNLYITANPVHPALLARATNRLRAFARETTADGNIVRRVWFLTDFDPVTPASGISATDAEMHAACARRDDAVAFLRELGFPAPVEAMSGNGGHAIWAGDFPNDEATRQLFEQALKALGARFTDSAVRVDEAVFNAARVWKLYTTMACKGDATPDRPHRRAHLERVPAELVPLDRELLTALAAMAPAPPRTVSAPRRGTGTLPPLDMVGAFQARGWYKRPLSGGKHAVTCPWASEHSGDSGVTETVLFEPRAAGELWGFKCQHQHCATRGIKHVIAVLGMDAGARPNGHPTGFTTDEEAAFDADPTPEAVAPPPVYEFTSPFPPGHFVGDWIRFASSCTDAPHEYHEALALVLLAAVTPQVKARIKFWPHGLRTNLYILLLGPSTTWRKSTAADLAWPLVRRVAPQVIGPDRATPEGFGEQLATRNGTTMLVRMDEFTGMLADLHHKPYMAGFAELLMKIYDGRDHRYTRHTKRKGKDGARETDEDLIQDPHLSFVGSATPAIFDPGALTRNDLTSGLLPRFAIVMPAVKPPRRGLDDIGEFAAGDETIVADLTARLQRLFRWADGPTRPVVFAPGVLAALDAFAVDSERHAALLDSGATALLDRMAAMAVKLAMLSAAGRPETVEGDTLHVSLPDATAAVTVARRWRADALAFADRVGEGVFDQWMAGACRILTAKGGTATRHVVVRRLHLKKKQADDLEATLVDHRRITVRKLPAPRGGEASVLWTLSGDSSRLPS